jgi:hypothetical protein
VREGGHLFSVAGGGFLDEYNQPLDVLKEVYGIQDQKLTLLEKNLWAKEGLAWVKPYDEFFLGWLFDTITDPYVSFPALIARQELVADEDRICADFRKGGIAAVCNYYGQGKAVLTGTFPGSAYVQQAIPKRPYDRGTSDWNFNHLLPLGFNWGACSFIADPFYAWAEGDSPESLSVLVELPEAIAKQVVPYAMFAGIRCDISGYALIDATVIEAPQGLAVPMANYIGKPIKGLTVTIWDVPEFKQIYSVKRGPLKYQRKGQEITVTLPLEWSDMMVIRR